MHHGQAMHLPTAVIQSARVGTQAPTHTESETPMAWVLFEYLVG
jgi:hypothetical protein